MKNLIQSVVTNNRQRKLAIPQDGYTQGKNYVHDSLVDEFNISLKQFETFARNDKIVYDCNSNNLTENPKLKRSKSFSRRSWRKKSGTKKNSVPSTETYTAIKDSDTSTETYAAINDSDVSTETYAAINDSDASTETFTALNDTDDVQQKIEQNTDRKKTHQRACSESFVSDKTEKARRHSTQETINNGTPKFDRRVKSLRRISSNSRKTKETLFENRETSSFDAIDFGSCHVPNEMKSWTIIQQKLATWSMSSPKRTSSPKLSTHRRNFSFSENITEPAKKLVASTLPTSLKRRKKSYECQKKYVVENTETNNEILDQPEEEKQENIQDVSLSREVIETGFSTDTDVSFSSNIWYYGELDIKCMNPNESTVSTTGKVSQPIYKKYTGSILARIDKYGDVVYSITYHYENDVIIAAIPHEAGKYCLDFTDVDQPRFSSVKFLIAHLIEQKYLHRVTFTWLIENCYT